MPIRVPRLSAAFLFVMPTRIVSPIVRFLGVQVHRNARVGFSWIEADQVILEAGTRIGHFNFVRLRRLVVKKNAAIGSMNWLVGPYSAMLAENSEIGARNIMTRSRFGAEVGPSRLCIGIWSKITAGHRFDLMRSICVGSNSVIAGVGSQFWTHGYVHVEADRSRYRVDGGISIGNNCYVGSACVFNPGVTLVDGVSVGSNASISKTLDQPGLYVSQALRHIQRDDADMRSVLVRVEAAHLSETVYTKPVKKKEFR